MSENLHHETEPLFAIDSKRHHTEWVDWSTGEKRTFDALIGIVINPLTPEQFEEDYSRIMDELFDSFSLERTRDIYKAYDIGVKFGPRVDAFKTFCLKFARKILSLDNVKVTYCFTRINRKYLDNNMVTIYGEYGSATLQVPVRDFLGRIEQYYNVICAWYVANANKIPRSRFLLDGQDSISPCHCWNQLKDNHNIEIVFNGDRLEPSISTADILLRSLDFFLKQTRKILDEDTIKNIILHDDLVPPENKFFYYIGNPHLAVIKPVSDRTISLNELNPFLRRPILFVSGGNISGQKDIIENQPIYDDILKIARSRRASLRFYNPRRDRFIIGSTSQKDLFLPLNEIAENQYELLASSAANLEKVEIE